jgi:murein DD-endopeptidase MepM/ murein hydrolase activator NlpD
MRRETPAQCVGVVLATWLLGLSGCNGSNPVGASDTPVCDATPGTGRPVLALLDRPFTGDFPLSNYFDHDLPITYDQSQDNNGYVLTFCGKRTGGEDGHPGYDWNMPTGTPLLAVADGVVLQAGEGPPQFCPPLNQVTTGLLVLLEHVAPTGEKFVSLLGHVSQVLVKTGEHVSAGQRIALSGTTGCSSGPHLHFEVGRVLGARRIQIDPYGWKGMGDDPWEKDPRGAASTWLWKPGQAPSVAP